MNIVMELTCQQARAMVSDYMNGELGEENVLALENHLQRCTSCPPLYASLVEVQRHLRQQHRPRLSPEALLRMAQRVSETVQDRQTKDQLTSDGKPVTSTNKGEQQ